MNLIFGFLMGSVLGSFIGRLLQLFSPNKHGANDNLDATAIADKAQADRELFERGADLAGDMTKYISVAKWFTMSSNGTDAWRGALPGQLKGFATFTIWSFLCRIAASAAYILGALELSKLIATSTHWNETNLVWQMVLPVILYTTLIGRTRWLLSWIFVPISLAYASARYRALKKSGEYGAIAIGMHSYPVLLSYGTVLGTTLAWMTGQRGNTSYSLTIILVCATVFTIVAAAVLGLVPRVLFNRGTFRLWSTNDAFRDASATASRASSSSNIANDSNTRTIDAYRQDIDLALSSVRPYDDPGDAVFKGDRTLNRLEAKEQLLMTWKHNLEHDASSKNITDEQQFAKRQVIWEKEAQVRAESDEYYVLLYKKSLEEPPSSPITTSPVSAVASKVPNLTREASVAANFDVADIPIFRWDSAFPTIDGHPGDIEPQLVKSDDGTFRFDSFMPLRPPTTD